MRPIDADALLEKDEWLTWDGDSYNVIHVVDVFCAPTLDVKPVRHGWWNWVGVWEYSECKYVWVLPTTPTANYCPNCGAKMDLPN